MKLKPLRFGDINAQGDTFDNLDLMYTSKPWFHPAYSIYIVFHLKFLFYFLLKIFLMFIHFWETEREHEWGRGRERGRHWIQSRLQAPSCHHRAQRRARTHGLQDHDLSRSWTLNRLSHPGAPPFLLINHAQGLSMSLDYIFSILVTRSSLHHEENNM